MVDRAIINYPLGWPRRSKTQVCWVQTGPRRPSPKRSTNIPGFYLFLGIEFSSFFKIHPVVCGINKAALCQAQTQWKWAVLGFRTRMGVGCFGLSNSNGTFAHGFGHHVLDHMPPWTFIAWLATWSSLLSWPSASSFPAWEELVLEFLLASWRRFLRRFFLFHLGFTFVVKSSCTFGSWSLCHYNLNFICEMCFYYHLKFAFASGFAANLAVGSPQGSMYSDFDAPEIFNSAASNSFGLPSIRLSIPWLRFLTLEKRITVRLLNWMV